MRTAKAYTAKLNAEALGRTFKVQDTNRRLFTTSLYRGAAGCGPINFTQISYVPSCECKYISVPAITPPPPAPPPPPVVITIFDGGTPSASGPNIIDGGTPSASGPNIVDGGNP